MEVLGTDRPTGRRVLGDAETRPGLRDWGGVRPGEGFRLWRKLRGVLERLRTRAVQLGLSPLFHCSRWARPLALAPDAEGPHGSKASSSQDGAG